MRRRAAQRTHHPRALLVAASRRHPKLVDASFTAHDAHIPAAEAAALGARSAADFAALSSYRYLIAVDGHGWQASLAAKLMLGSAVISHASYYPTWFQPLLFFGEHLLLVDAQWRGLAAAVRRLRGDDAMARRIARQGEARIEELLREEHLVGYVRDLIHEYQRLMVPEEEAPSAVASPPVLRRGKRTFAATRPGGRRSLTIGLGGRVTV